MISRLFHFNRLAGCLPPIMDFFGWWAANGPFPITIPANGGLRTSEEEQARLFAMVRTKARSLKETPHGRGAAGDAYPAILDPSGTRVLGIHTDPKLMLAREMFEQYGELAETHGLEWGGRFGPLDAHGLGWDLPHVEIPNWRELPFPPTTFQEPKP